MNFDDVVWYVKLNDAAFDLSNGPVIDEVLFLFFARLGLFTTILFSLSDYK